MFVAQSGLVLICLVATQMGCTLWSYHQWGRIWGEGHPLNNHSQTAPIEGDEGVAKLKCTPALIFALSQCPSSRFATPRPNCYNLLPPIATLQGNSDQGLIRIADFFRADGATIFVTPFLAIFGTFLDSY